MYLRDISISVDRDFVPGSNFTHRDFNRGTHAACIAFRKALPKKFDLDGCGKINIYLHPRPELDKIYTKLIDVSVLYFEGFDFNAYLRAVTVEKQQILLATIQAALIQVARLINADQSVIKEAYQKTLQLEFPLDDSWLEWMDKRVARTLSQR